MPKSESQARAIKKYEKNNYFKALIRFKKEDEQRIRAAAGDNSLNKFVVEATLDRVRQIEALNNHNY